MSNGTPHIREIIVVRAFCSLQESHGIALTNISINMDVSNRPEVLFARDDTIREVNVMHASISSAENKVLSLWMVLRGM